MQTDRSSAIERACRMLSEGDVRAATGYIAEEYPFLPQAKAPKV